MLGRGCTGWALAKTLTCVATTTVILRIHGKSLANKNGEEAGSWFQQRQDVPSRGCRELCAVISRIKALALQFGVWLLQQARAYLSTVLPKHQTAKRNHDLAYRQDQKDH